PARPPCEMRAGDHERLAARRRAGRSTALAGSKDVAILCALAREGPPLAVTSGNCAETHRRRRRAGLVHRDDLSSRDETAPRSHNMFTSVHRGIVPIVLAAVLAVPARAQCSQWDPRFAPPGTDGTVQALAVYDDGSGPALFVGGTFA